MYARILVLLFLTACAPHVETPTIPTRAPVAWVPEARALLGHVEDDALADFDAELGRVRAIARFEIEGEDPDFEGFRRLLELHAFDKARADAGARARIRASHELLVAALPLTGAVAFEAILDFAPELLVSEPDAFLALLRSSQPLGDGFFCEAPRGFYVDTLTRDLSCIAKEEPRIADVFRNVRGDVRSWLRLRGYYPPNDALSPGEARVMAEGSYFPARGFLYALIARGDYEGAATLGAALLTKDPHDIGARLATMLRDEVTRGVLPRDPELLRLLLVRAGPAYLAHRFEGSEVAKLALLEVLAYSDLPEDYDAVRNAIPSSGTDKLGALLPLLDATAHPPVLGIPDSLASAVRDTGSPSLRAYLLVSPAAELTLAPRTLLTRPALAAVLTVDPPSFFPFRDEVYGDAPDAVRMLLERLDSGRIRARARRIALCHAARTSSELECESRPRDPTTLEAIDLDTVTLDALERTRYVHAAALLELLDRSEGTPVSAREAYVRLRIRALIESGALDEARRRLSSDGRILSRTERLFLEAARLDAEAGSARTLPSPLRRLLGNSLEHHFARGCPTPLAEADEGETAPTELVAALARVSDDRRSFADLEALLPRFTGNERETLAAFVTLRALAHRDRDATTRALAATAPTSTLLGAALRAAARRRYQEEPLFAPEAAWLGAFFDARTAPARSEDLAPAPEAADPGVLPTALSTAYLTYQSTGEPSAAARFLALRAPDENARRVQCDVAIQSFPKEGMPRAVFGLPLPRELRRTLDTLIALCIPRGATSAPVEALRIVRDFDPEPKEAVRSLVASLPSESAFDFEVDDSLRLRLVTLAMRSEPPAYTLLRVAGMPPALTLVLESRTTEATRSAARTRHGVHPVDALREDLAARRITPMAALAALTTVLPPESRGHYGQPDTLSVLLAEHPRARSLAWIATALTAEHGVFFATEGDVLLRLAHDDAPLLRALAQRFDDSFLSSLAERARTRARVLEPNFREPVPEADENCDPP